MLASLTGILFAVFSTSILFASNILTQSYF
nr:MAG TPA: hypothetical protein [Caudoviricetes sp.]